MWLFLNTSKYVSVPIITDWLTLEDLIDLDSALCNHKCREAYLKLLMEFPHVIEDKLLALFICPCIAWLDWIESRTIEVVPKGLVIRNRTLTAMDRLFARNRMNQSLMKAEQIQIDRLTTENEQQFQKLLSHCSDLTHITITNSLSINNVITSLSLSGSRLTSLCLKGCYQLYDPVAEVLLRECINLTDLDLSNCYQLTSRVMRCMTVHCRKIQRFNMQAFSMLNVTRDTLTLIHHNFTQGRLTHFIMSRVNNPIVKSLIWYCGAGLQELDYANSYYLNHESVDSVPLCCPHLTKINTSYCYTLPESSVGSLSVIPSLTSIDVKDLHYLSNKSVSRLATRCSPSPFAPLVEIVFYNAPSVSHESLLLLAELCANTLTTLMLSDMRLTDAVLTALCTHLSGGSLRRLGLSVNKKLTDPGMEEGVRLCGHSLTALEFMAMGPLTDATLHSVAQHCHQLKAFDTSNNDLLTDHGAEALLRSCRGLTHFNINQCQHISNATLLSILRYLRRSITSVNVLNCHSITGDQLKSFVSAAPRLREVRTSLTRTISFKMFTDVHIYDS